jgi:hypothetical protein
MDWDEGLEYRHSGDKIKLEFRGLIADNATLTRGTPMNIRIVFGYLFLLLSIIFCVVQLIILQVSEQVAGMSLVLQFCSTLACLLLASLAIQRSHRTAMVVISVLAFGVCFLALLSGGILAIRGTVELATVKYVIFLAYGGLYGIFGLACSLLAGKATTNEAGKDA